MHCLIMSQTMQARQKWHITADKGFASSSNARNELMLRDAGEFAGHIKRCEKDIRILKNATEGQNLSEFWYLQTEDAVLSDDIAVCRAHQHHKGCDVCTAPQGL